MKVNEVDQIIREMDEISRELDSIQREITQTLVRRISTIQRMIESERQREIVLERAVERVIIRERSPEGLL